MLALRGITDNVCKCTSSIRLSTAPSVKIQYADVHGGSGPLSVYSADEKSAIRALGTQQSDTYYLFLAKDVVKLDPDGNRTIVGGYMPVGRQFGFIFEQFDVASTIAHEVSHGAFSLHHTFSDESESYHAASGTTPNLMDYSTGTTLNHLQWQWMHESHTNLLGFLDDEEESESENFSNSLTDTRLRDICLSARNNEYVSSIEQYITPNKDCRITMPKEHGNEFVYFYDTKANAEKYLYDNNPLNDATYAIAVIEDKNGVTERLDAILENTQATCVDVYNESNGVDFCLELIRKIKLSIISKSNYRYDFGTNKQISAEAITLPNGNVIEDVKVSINNPTLDISVTDVQRKFEKSALTTSDSVYCFGEQDQGGNYPLEISCNYDCSKYLSSYWETSIQETNVVAEKVALIKDKAQQAVDKILEYKETEDAACNLCTRAALYYITNDPVLFPQSGSYFNIKTLDDKKQAIKGKVSGDGSAKYIVEDLNNGLLKDYFEEIKKDDSESYEEFWAHIQNMADNGEIIIGAYKTNHVFMVVPGGLCEVVDNTPLAIDYQSNPDITKGDKWGYAFASRNINYVPRILECGVNIKSAEAPLYGNMCFDKNAMTIQIRWYKYKFQNF